MSTQISHKMCWNYSQEILAHGYWQQSWTCPPCYLNFMHELPFHSSPLNTSLTGDLNRSGVSDNSGEELPTAWYRTQIKDYYKNNLSIGHLNINSIFSKIDEVIDILNECHFNILFLSETKLDNSVSSTLLSNPHYRIIHRDRKRSAGGLLVYIRNSVVARHQA